MSRRTTELLLLLLAVIPVGILFTLVETYAAAEFDWTHLIIPAALFALFGFAHIVVRITAPNADPLLLPLTFVLCGIGIAFITRLVPDQAISQIYWLIISIVVFAVTLFLVPSLEKLGRYKYLLMLSGLILLVLPAIIGIEINGSHRWIHLFGLSIQPGEMARILIILFLAAYFAENREMLSISTRKFLGIPLPELRTLAPLVVMWAISFLILVYETDLGGSLMFFCIFLVMLYAATGRLSYIVVGTGLFAAGATVAYHMFAHVQDRVAIWSDPFAHAMERGYQLVQSLFALAAGGLIGTGPGAGLPTRIPFADTDFIFAAIGEEIGLLGAAAVLICFLTFVYRGLLIASRAKTDMAAFAAVGFSASIGLQVFIIVGGVTGLIPLTGITLPFVSRGGSSMVSSFLLLALLLRAGDESPGAEVELKAIGGGHAILGRLALARRLGALAVFFTMLIGAVLVNLTWIQTVRADSLQNNPYNTRDLAAEMRVARGSILSADGVVLAESIRNDDGTYRRVYPQGTLAAHTLGYYSFEFGRTGIEAAANTTLTGTRTFSSWSDVIDAAAGRPIQGDDVVLTIDSRIQKAAEDALGARVGGIVALDPRTGAVLASVSSPAFDPATIDTEMEALQAGELGVLVDRTRSTRLSPGSTFKVVTLAAAFSEEVATPDTVYPAPGSMDIGNAPVTNFEGRGLGSLTLTQATVYSANTVFGQLAVDIGAEKFVAQVNRFGFGQDIPYEFEVLPGIIPAAREMTTWELAWAGSGQAVGTQTDASGSHPSPPGPQATVMHMALVTAGIANAGDIMRPFVIDAKPRSWLTAIDVAVARQVGDIMKASGAGSLGSVAGVAVAGKTGTAEVGADLEPNAWFIAYAPADDPVIALAILVEGGGMGAEAAAPLARPIIEAALRR